MEFMVRPLETKVMTSTSLNQNLFPNENFKDETDFLLMKYSTLQYFTQVTVHGGTTFSVSLSP